MNTRAEASVPLVQRKGGTLNLARPFPFSGRQVLIALAAAALVGGAALNRGWLVALGIAPLLLSLAPCIAMCALGLCMMRGSKGCGSQRSPGDQQLQPVPVKLSRPGQP